MVLPYMVTFIPSIYPSHVSKEIPALWIRHGIPQLQISWSDDRPKGAPVLPHVTDLAEVRVTHLF